MSIKSYTMTTHKIYSTYLLHISSLRPGQTTRYFWSNRIVVFTSLKVISNQLVVAVVVVVGAVIVSPSSSPTLYFFGVEIMNNHDTFSLFTNVVTVSSICLSDNPAIRGISD